MRRSMRTDGEEYLSDSQGTDAPCEGGEEPARI